MTHTPSFGPCVCLPPCRYAFLDIALTTPDLGPDLHPTRVVVELFRAELPRTVDNFLHICTGDTVHRPLCSTQPLPLPILDRVIRVAWQRD
jgi:hypothetical protein